jgi:hypothetical protein
VAYCYTRRYKRDRRPIDEPTELTGNTFARMMPEFFARRFWCTGTPLYRRALLDRIGPWTDLPFWEDIEYDLRIAVLNPQLYHCREFLMDIRDHGSERLSKHTLFHQPELLAHVPRALRLLYEHAKRFGLTPRYVPMQLFLEEIGLVAGRCREFGLDRHLRDCLAILEDAGFPASTRSITESRLEATIEPLQREITVRPTEVVRVPVRVVNNSSLALRAGEFIDFGLTYHVLSESGEMLAWDNQRTYFHQPILPDGARLIGMTVEAPDRPGTYVLELDIICERVAWFSQRGNTTPAITLRVGGRGEGESRSATAPDSAVDGTRASGGA